MDYRTRILHTGKDKDPHTGASSISICQASTFAQDDPLVFGQYEYARGANPTRDALEHTIAVLEGAAGVCLFLGMAAISSVFLLFKTGDHMLVGEDVYGGTYRVLTKLFHRWGLRYTFADIRPPARCEPPSSRHEGDFRGDPSNPTLKITDLAAMVQVARERNLLTLSTTPS